MMRVHRTAGAAAVLILLTMQVSAQRASDQTPQTVRTQPQTEAKPPSSDSTMGVSLKNIRKQVPVPPEIAPVARSGLRYDFFVDVYGKRPAIDFFKDFDLSAGGAVRWGGVTHQEILNAATPFPFHIYTGGIEVLGGTKKKK